MMPDMNVNYDVGPQQEEVRKHEEIQSTNNDPQALDRLVLESVKPVTRADSGLPDELSRLDKDDIMNLLMAFATVGDIESVHLLIDEGFDINRKNKDGDTALSLAEKYGHNEVVKLLKKSGAK